MCVLRKKTGGMHRRSHGRRHHQNHQRRDRNQHHRISPNHLRTSPDQLPRPRRRRPSPPQEQPDCLLALRPWRTFFHIVLCNELPLEEGRRSPPMEIMPAIRPDASLDQGDSSSPAQIGLGPTQLLRMRIANEEQARDGGIRQLFEHCCPPAEGRGKGWQRRRCPYSRS